MAQSGQSAHVRLNDRFAAGRETQPVPSHERILLIAKVARRDPTALAKEEIQALADAMIMHYAQMGIG
jgi:hypothetical protein